MPEKMCKMNKEERKQKSDTPGYKCKKCGRESDKKKHVCKPKKID